MACMFPVVPETRLVGAVDARDILPVQDEHGGVTIYYRGRPSLYMLAGEWYRASPEPEAFGQATSTVVDHFLAQPGSRHNPID